MESLFGTLLVVALLSALGFFTWEQYDFAKAQIHGDLRRLHASRIELALEWTHSTRDSFAFYVEYSTPDGARHANECRVFKQTLGVAWARPLKGSA